MSITCLVAWALALLILPFLIIERLIETQPEQIRRLHRQGHSQRAIAERLGITRHRVRVALA
jgi:DNA invertase Pin-like site-specific DNA recombinase